MILAPAVVACPLGSCLLGQERLVVGTEEFGILLSVANRAFDDLGHLILGCGLLDTQEGGEFVPSLQISIVRSRRTCHALPGLHGCRSLLNHGFQAAGLWLGSSGLLDRSLPVGLHVLGFGRVVPGRSRSQVPLRRPTSGSGQGLLGQLVTLSIGQIGKDAVRQLGRQVVRASQRQFGILLTVQRVVVGAGWMRRTGIVLPALVVVFDRRVFTGGGLVHADVQLHLVLRIRRKLRRVVHADRLIALVVRFVLRTSRTFARGLATVVDVGARMG